MNNAIISSYVKSYDGKPFGLVVAAKLDDGTFNIDYSVCHDMDVFNKDSAREIATNRALQNRKKRVSMRITNKEVLYAYKTMINRSLRYFKNCNPSDKVKWVIREYSLSTYDM